MGNTIVALATPPLKSALGVIRSSGDECFDIVSSFFSKDIRETSARTIYVGKIKDEDKIVDEVVLLAYPAPKTQTGEDVVEIMFHGSMLIANEIISLFIKHGARLAANGEFTSRAFYNGKMDLIEAEAVNDMINATTKESKDLYLMSLTGGASSLVKPLRDELANLLALIEVNIDYPEYDDIEEANKFTIKAKIAEIIPIIDDLIKGGEEGKIIRNGIKVAIVGRPNVGKSSLLNALLKENKAIVSAIPGTTRDVVEGDISLKGVPVHLLDTAGIRENADEIEKFGIEKSRQTIEEADMIIHLYEDGDDFVFPEGKDVIKVHNKADLAQSRIEGELYISALNGDIAPLLDAMYEALGLSDAAFKKPSLGNARELGVLKNILSCLREASSDCDNDAPMDIVSVNIKNAYNLCRELLGEGATNDLTDEIFSRFCVGK